MSLKHGFQSAIADGGDSTVLKPSNWGSTSTNYATTPTHVFDGGALGSLLYRDTGHVEGANWLADVAAGRLLVSDGVGAVPVWRTELQVTAAAVTSTVPFKETAALGLGVVSTDGLVAENTTTAAAGAQQISPRIRLTGQGWKTDATAASRTVDWALETLPVQGAANPTANLLFKSQINGAGYNTRASLDSGGAWIMTGNIDMASAGAILNATAFYAVSTGSRRYNSRFEESSPADGQLVWTNTAGSAGIGFSFSTDTILRIRNRAQNADAAITASYVGHGALTFATLPTGVAGHVAYITDCNTATWGATAAGGGANKVLVWFNGTNWTVAGA